MSDAALATPPSTKKDPSRQMSAAAAATADKIVSPDIYA